MYVTTSRKPSQNTRILARTISSFISGDYDNRGKKSIDSIVSTAQKKGHTRAMVISETKGNPNRLSFIEIPDKSLPDEEGWKWLEPDILFNVSAADVKRMKTLNKEFTIQADSKDDQDTLTTLFDPPESMSDDPVVIHASEKHITFTYGDYKLTLKLR